MLFSTISLLSLTSIGAHAAVLGAHTVSTGCWQLVTKPPGDSTAIGIPIVLGQQPENSATRLATGAATDIPLCIELTRTTNAQGVPFAGAKVLTHPSSVAEDIWLWKSLGAKQLATSTRINIAGIRGNWTFVGDGASADMLLALDGETAAGVSSGGGVVHFGADVPVAVGALPVVVVGVPVESCAV